MFKILGLIILLALSLIAIIPPDFLPSESQDFPELYYRSAKDGVYAYRPGISSLSAFYPRDPVLLDASDSSAIVNSCLHYINKNPHIFVGSSDEFFPIKVINRLDRWWLTFAQIRNGILVEGGRADFRVFSSGKMAICGANYLQYSESPRALISTDIAIDEITRRYGISGTLTACDLVYWPDYSLGDALARLAWRIDIYQAPERRFRFYCSAKDGRPLTHFSTVQFYDVVGSASIEFLPKFYDDPLSLGPYQFGNISLGFTSGINSDASGGYLASSYLTTEMPLRAKLKGLWVDVIDIEGVNGLYEFWLRAPAEHNFTFSTAYADTDEVNLFYHTTHIHEYYERLDPPMTALDYPVPARAGVASMPENAFWDGYGTNYGSGGSTMRNFALFANIVYHEYTHGITGWHYEGVYFPYSGQSGAMNEGFSDYFACTNLSDPRIGFKTPIYGLTMFRTIDNNLRMPSDWSGEVHADGRIFGGALWALRQRTRISRADSIIHFTKYATPNTFNGFVPEALFTDDDDEDLSNGSPDCVAIFEAFAKHGIGPGLFPQLSFEYDIIEWGDGDGFYEEGETLMIIPKVIADGGFPWPNLVNLRGSLFIDDESGVRVIERATAFSPTIYPGDTSVGNPILVAVNSVSLSYFTDFVIEFTALNVTAEIADTMRILIGFPQVLLLDDSPEVHSRSLRYFTKALDELRVSYYPFRTLGGPISINLDEFSLVLWFTGDDTAGTAIDEGDVEIVGGFLERGGRLLLTGQNMTLQFDSSFLDHHFGAVHKINSGGLAISGVGDNPILGQSEGIFLFGTQGANNQRIPTAISPTRGEPIAKYSNNDTCGVIHDNGISRTALFSFGLEAIGGNTTSVSLVKLLFRLMNWFEVPTSVDEQAKLPERIEIRVLPNPFNSTCTIEVPHKSAKLEIFDISGRLVRAFDIQNASANRLVWDGKDNYGKELPSGTYLIRTALNSSNCKAVLLR